MDRLLLILIGCIIGGVVTNCVYWLLLKRYGAAVYAEVKRREASRNDGQ